MTPAPDEMTVLIRRFWAEALDVSEVPENGDFFELGGDSMAAVGMLTAVLDHYDTDIDLECFFGNPTIRVLRDLIGHARGGRP